MSTGEELAERVVEFQRLISFLSPESQQKVIKIVEEMCNHHYNDGRKDGSYYGPPPMNLYPEKD